MIGSAPAGNLIREERLWQRRQVIVRVVNPTFLHPTHGPERTNMCIAKGVAHGWKADRA
jgi:hypothetical protein